MFLVAHRGLQSKNTKENTLKAIKLGDNNPNINAVEIDVRLTKDDEVVVIHDENIDRVSNGKGYVREMSLERLKRFNLGSFINRASISTLEEVLDKFSSNTLLIIELKDELNKSILLAKKVVEITSKYSKLNIWFKSFSSDIVRFLKNNTDRKVGILINKNNIDNLNLDMDFYSISKKIINDDIVDDVLSKNKPLMIWTVNTKEDMEMLKNNINLDLNNIYIISDNPLLFNK